MEIEINYLNCVVNHKNMNQYQKESLSTKHSVIIFAVILLAAMLADNL